MRIALLALALLPQSGPDELSRKIVQAFGTPEKLDAADETAARNSAAFGPRYAVLLLDIHRSIARGTGYESVYRSLVQFTAPGSPRAAADHFRALAAGFKKAAYCKECKDGKVACDECKGKGKLSQKCKECGGEGRTKPPGATGKTDVTVKCRNCDGNGFFKDAGCPGCSKTGQKNCPSCLGRPWHDRKCAVPECRDGRIRCADCGGKCKLHPKCTDCDGKGRSRPGGAVGGTDLVVKCRTCDGKGVLDQELKCPTCGANGFVPCKACAGDEKARFHAPLSEVLSVNPCSACSGRGTSCSSCSGLGVRVVPASEPSKTLGD